MATNIKTRAAFSLSWLLVLALLFVHAAAAQTNIKLGDKYNLTGATAYVDLSSLDPNNLKPGDNSNAPIDLRSGAKIAQWMGGFASGQWSQTPGIAGSCNFSNLYGNGDAQVYPNGDCLRSGMVGATSQRTTQGLVITPRPFTAAEAALVAKTNFVSGYTPTILSSAFNTFPYGIRAPLYAVAKVIFPDDMGFGSGDWPAVWLLSASLNWPPEIDVQDGYNGGLPNTLLNHGIVRPDQTGDGGSTAPAIKAGVPVEIMVILYNDHAFFFQDGICTNITDGANVLTDGGQQPLWYLILNYAIQGRTNAWPGTMPAGKTVWRPMTVQSVSFGAMPIAYPGPGDGKTIPALGGGTVTPPPPPPPVTTGFTLDTTIPASVSGTFTISGTAGSTWVNVGLFNAAGTNLGSDVKPTNGKWSLSIDTTKLPVGANALTVMAFSVPAGQSGGTSASVPLTLTVAQPAPPPASGLTAAQKAAMALVTTDQAGVTTTQAALNAALAKLQADLIAARKALGVP